MGSTVVKRQADIDLGTSNAATLFAAIAQGLTAASDNAKARQASKDAANAKIGEMFMEHRFKRDLAIQQQEFKLEQLGTSAGIAQEARGETFGFSSLLKQQDQFFEASQDRGTRLHELIKQRRGFTHAEQLQSTRQDFLTLQAEIERKYKTSEREAGEGFKFLFQEEGSRLKGLEADHAMNRTMQVLTAQTNEDIRKLGEQYTLIGANAADRFSDTLQLHGLREDRADARATQAVNARLQINDQNNAMDWKIAELRSTTGGAGKWSQEAETRFAMYKWSINMMQDVSLRLAKDPNNEEAQRMIGPLMKMQEDYGTLMNESFAKEGIGPLPLFKTVTDPGKKRKWLWDRDPDPGKVIGFEAKPIEPTAQVTPAQALSLAPQASQLGAAAGPPPVTTPRPVMTVENSRKNLIAAQTRMLEWNLPKQELIQHIKEQQILIRKGLTDQDYSRLVEWVTRQPDFPGDEEAGIPPGIDRSKLKAVGE